MQIPRFSPEPLKQKLWAMASGHLHFKKPSSDSTAGSSLRTAALGQRVHLLHLEEVCFPLNLYCLDWVIIRPESIHAPNINRVSTMARYYSRPGDANMSKSDKIPVLMELIVCWRGQILFQNNILIYNKQWKLLCKKRIAYGSLDLIWEDSLLQGCDIWDRTLRWAWVSKWGMFVGEERDSDVGRTCTKAVRWGDGITQGTDIGQCDGSRRAVDGQESRE